MTDLLRPLLMIAVLLLSLSGHGTAMGQGSQADTTPVAARAGMHHGPNAHCDTSQSCPAQAQFDSCCVIGHCLLGLLAAGAAPLPPFQAAKPFAVPGLAAIGVPQDSPERPPRLA